MKKQRIFWGPLRNLLCICGESTRTQIETNFRAPTIHVQEERNLFRTAEVPTGDQWRTI